MATFDTHIEIDAPVGRVWDALADIGSIGEWNPKVKNARIVSESDGGVGAARVCDLPGGRYVREEVVEWEPGRGLTTRVVDSNLPFRHSDVRFRLEERGGRTVVTVSPEYAFKGGAIGALIDRLVGRKAYRKGMESLLAGLKRHVEAVQDADAA